MVASDRQNVNLFSLDTGSNIMVAPTEVATQLFETLQVTVIHHEERESPTFETQISTLR